MQNQTFWLGNKNSIGYRYENSSRVNWWAEHPVTINRVTVRLSGYVDVDVKHNCIRITRDAYVNNWSASASLRQQATAYVAGFEQFICEHDPNRVKSELEILVQSRIERIEEQMKELVKMRQALVELGETVDAVLKTDSDTVNGVFQELENIYFHWRFSADTMAYRTQQAVKKGKAS